MLYVTHWLLSREIISRDSPPCSLPFRATPPKKPPTVAISHVAWMSRPATAAVVAARAR
eukprot:COSAG06_NODE_5579_length_3390_cov_9.053024_6_plen_59_part_00